MSLRLRLLAIFGGLLLLMMASEWWLVRSLTKQYEKRTGQVAFHVGESLLSAFGDIDVETSPRPGTQSFVFGAAPRSFSFEPHPPPKRIATAVPAPRQFATLSGKEFKGPRLVLAFETRKKGQGDKSSKALKTVKGVKRRVFKFKQPFFPSAEEEVEIILSPEQRKQEREIEVRILKELIDQEKLFDPKGKKEDQAKLLKELLAQTKELRAQELELSKAKGLKAQLFLEDPSQQYDVMSLPRDNHWQHGPGPQFWFPSKVPSTQSAVVEFKPPQAEKDVYFSGNNLFIPIPQEGLKEAQQAFLRQWLYGSAFILLVGLLAVAWIAHHVSKPLQELADAAKDVGDGKLGTQVNAKGDREVLSTVAAFNKMSQDLERLTKETKLLRDREHLTEIGEMSRGLAHSLRNPLNILGLCLEELGELAGNEGEDLARSSRDQIERMDRSLRSLLALSTSRAVQELSMDDVARDVALEITQGQLGSVNLEIQSTEPAPVIKAVAPEIRAVIHAIMVNAVEASPKNGTVTVALDTLGNGHVLIRVDDEGPGLPQEIRDRLFMPNQTTKEHGTGMGLFLAHRIVTNRYQGRLSVLDRPQGGTRVEMECSSRTDDSHG